MRSKHTKAGRRDRFRRSARRQVEFPEFVFRLRPLSERCRSRCGGSGWLDCWCGLCGEEECFGCSDCLYDETYSDGDYYDGMGGDDFDDADDFYEPDWASAGGT